MAMAKATDHSTTKMTRRAAIAAAMTMAASPATAAVPTEPDPIFPLIEKYRQACAAFDELLTEIGKKEEVSFSHKGVLCGKLKLEIDNLGGLSTIELWAGTHEEIDTHLPPALAPEVNKIKHQELDTLLTARKQENVETEAMEIAGSRRIDAVIDELLEVTPTTVGGLLAVIALIRSEYERGDNGFDDHADSILSFIERAVL